jgi:hypothetical protein
MEVMFVFISCGTTSAKIEQAVIIPQPCIEVSRYFFEFSPITDLFEMVYICSSLKTTFDLRVTYWFVFLEVV